jgi:hypothetical protein
MLARLPQSSLFDDVGWRFLKLAVSILLFERASYS